VKPSTTEKSSVSSSVSRNALSRRGRPLVLLDTNALFLPVRTRFPLEAEVDRLCPGAFIAVPESVLGELDRLILRDTPGAAAARALGAKYRRLSSAGTGDDAVVRAAVQYRAWVVTSDRALRERLSREGVTVLSPRDRHRLQIHAAQRARPS
jgi:rRNA-processing protein FCF1